MYRKVWNLNRVVSLLLILGMAVALLNGCGRNFDASAYTKAVLDLQFQGETQEARQYLEEDSQISLTDTYQQFVDSFVSDYLTAGLEIGEIRTTEFAKLASAMFASMQYSVGEAKKTAKDSYEVSVTFQPNDTFIRYQAYLKADAERIRKKVRAGEYEGKDTDAQNEVLREIATDAYDLLERAFQESAYGDPKSVTLRVTGGKKTDYSINEEDMNELIVKILRLDEIGD